MIQKPLFVRAEWDEETQVWVATSDDVPGLATEGDSIELLIEKLKTLIPELLIENGMGRENDIPFEVITRRFETAHAMGH
jgi:predicted RNase H-like HicB family nuclease